MKTDLMMVKLNTGLVYLVACNEFFQHPIASWDSIEDFAEFIRCSQEFLAEARIPILPAILRAFKEV